MPLSTHLVYSPRYNISLYGLERLHPFDAHKYGRAYARLLRRLGPALKKHTLQPERPARRTELLAVHAESYLRRLRRSRHLARALELPLAFFVPGSVLDRHKCAPMRWAVRGSVLAGQAALESGFAVNLSGGYHHAKPAHGEGFCVYADIALVVYALRTEGRIGARAPVAYIDLDAHQGNGVCHCFMEDQRVRLFDMYNASIFPVYDYQARQRLDYDVPLAPGTGDAAYLRELQKHLPRFLDGVGERGGPTSGDLQRRDGRRTR